MSKYEKQGQSKIINSYGAVGTLIQTMKNGSLKIEDFDKWPYYRKLYNKYLTQIDTGYLLNPEFIKDDRLVQKLQDLSPSIIGIFRMPENEENFGDISEPNNVISASLFPEWFFCPSCGTMKHHSQLIVGHTRQMPRHCNMFMEQFSFVLISESGEIADIPWKEYLTEDGNKISFNAIAPDNSLVLKYSTGGSAEFLETKTVTATIDGRTITKSLGPLASKEFISAGTTYKMAIRQGNNLCFVKTWSSLYVPKYVIPAAEFNSINALVIANLDANAIMQILSAQYPNTQTTVDHINSFLNARNLPEIEKDEQYKWEEFDFIVNQPNDNFTNESIEIYRHPYNVYGIKNIHRVSKLKVTHVQTGYTRLKPSGTSKKIFTNPNVVYYPGVEMQGEGMLLEFDVNKLNTYINNPRKNSNTVEMNNMMHSLSHCIMKELEFECGYPLNSLKERMYFGTEEINGTKQVKYAGVLIYSATGTNSSFGGIANLFEDNLRKLNILFDNAIMRATDCPNDPICIEEEKHGNKGVCYSCNLIPETSCENFNSGLDRASLIDFTNTINP
jgi:hypothetical protein